MQHVKHCSQLKKVKSESNLHVLLLIDANNRGIVFSLRVIGLMLFQLLVFKASYVK